MANYQFLSFNNLKVYDKFLKNIFLMKMRIL